MAGTDHAAGGTLTTLLTVTGQMRSVASDPRISRQTIAPLPMNLFTPAADMSPAEQQSFKDWARANYIPFEPISGLWHPIIQAECTLINQETEVSL